MPALEKALEGADPNVLAGALDALADLGESIVPGLIKSLEFEEARPRIAALLGRIGPAAKAAVPALIGVLSDDNSETPDTQVAVYDFPGYTLVFEQQLLGGLGPNGRPHGMLFCGTEGTVVIDDSGWEIIPEPKKKSLEPAKHPAGPDARPAHVRNFLDCVKSREQPVENLEIGHHVSTVAHLGNIALLTKSEIHWDAKKERITSGEKADDMVGAHYRKPWKLPYGRRS